jgi:ATP/maltotriose-dependent transcriptional regulator MalT
MTSGCNDVSLGEKNGMNLLTRLLFRVLLAASVHGGELDQIALRLLLVWRNFQKSNEHVFRCAVCSKVEHQQWIRTGVEEEQKDVTLNQAQLSTLDYCDLKLCVRTKNLFFFEKNCSQAKRSEIIMFHFFSSSPLARRMISFGHGWGKCGGGW